jgi:hypothetical protein
MLRIIFKKYYYKKKKYMQKYGTSCFLCNTKKAEAFAKGKGLGNVRDRAPSWSKDVYEDSF